MKLLLWLALLCALQCCFCKNEPDLVVHLVPHSHVNAGWQETSEEYYINSVSDILTQVLNQLDHNVKRRFVWAEVMYFSRWYDALSQVDKDRVLRVIKDGQLEFVGGGWVEHDEGLPSFESILNQMSAGHDWLFKNFGVRPSIGWQIDSSGHSDVTPALLGHMGYEAVVINRIHYRIKQQFKSSKHLEFFWQGTSLGGEASPLFTHVLAEDYSAPDGYDFESPGVRQVTNAKRRSDRLVKELRLRASYYKTHHLMVPFGDDLRFIAADKQFSNMEKLMRSINENSDGVEIRFSTASEYFRSVRKTIAVTSMKLPVHSGDFFPYADSEDSYWSGLYSTRPQLKQACRGLDSSVRSSNMLYALARSRASVIGDAPAILKVENGQVYPDHTSMAPSWGTELYNFMESAKLTSAEMSQHHGITGASKSDVVDDYFTKIEQATMKSNKVILASLEQLLTKRQSSSTDGLKVRPTLTTLPFLFDKASGGIQHPIIFHNVKPTKRIEVYHLNINSPFLDVRHIQVVDADGAGVEAQIYQTLVPQRSERRDGRKWRPQTVLSFVVEVPPFGFSTYFVSTTSARERLRSNNKIQSASAATTSVYEMIDGEVVGATEPEEASQSRGVRGNVQSSNQQFGEGEAGIAIESSARQAFVHIENQFIKVELELATGLLKAIEDKRVDRRTLLRQHFAELQSVTSGVHLFRPDKSPLDVGFGQRMTISVVSGPLVYEINVLGHSGISQRIRLIKVQSMSQTDALLLEGHVDVSHTVTPERDTDLVLRYETSMNTAGKFYTDNSAGGLVERQAHPDAPFESSFFPLYSSAALQDSQATSKTRMGQMLSVISAQPLAVSSPVQGAGKTRDFQPASRSGNAGLLDFVLHRNHETDDGKGLREGLNDYSTAQVEMRIAVDIPSAMRLRLADLSERLRYPLKPVFALENLHVDQILNRASWVSRFRAKGAYVVPGIPSHLQVQSFYSRDAISDEVVVRFRNTLLNADDDSIRIELSNFFVSKRILSVRARTLDATAPEQILKELRLGDVSSDTARTLGGTNDEALTGGSGLVSGRATSDGHKSQTQLLPGELRCFVFNFLTLKDNQLPLPDHDKPRVHPKDPGIPSNIDPVQVPIDDIEPATKLPTVKFGGSISVDATIDDLTRIVTPNMVEKEQLQVKIDKDRKMIAVLENRVKRSKAAIEDLLQDLKIMGDDDDSEDKGEMLEELRSTQETLGQATLQLEERKAELYGSYQRLAQLEGRMPEFGVDYEMRQWDANLHGIVTGAGGMLVFVLGFNLLRSRLSSIPNVALPNVPIKWVGFSPKDQEGLPFYEEEKDL